MSRFQSKTVTELRDIKAGLAEVDTETSSPETDDSIVQCTEEIDAVIAEKSAAALANLKHYVYAALHTAFAQTGAAVPGTDAAEFDQTAFELLSTLDPEQVAAACAGTLTE